MILEGIVTTQNADGSFNAAPMGPRVDDPIGGLLLRPFPTSQTCQNLMDRQCGVFHVVDDVLLLARVLVGQFDVTTETFPAEQVEGVVLQDACRWYEFLVDSIDTSGMRVEMPATVVHHGHIRELFGFNRAKHAVLEAAILATRVHLLDHDDLLAQLDSLRIPVEKTAGPKESAAFEMIVDFVQQQVAAE